MRHNATKTVLEYFNIKVLHQSIENWIFKHENFILLNNGRCSGYYIFDVEWVKLKGKWWYRHTLLDNVTKEVIAEAIYPEETKETVKEFLKKATANKNKKVITTDLDKKYAPIIEKLGFKQQYCIFHAKKAFNKALKKKGLSEKEHKKAMKQLKKVTDIFNYTNFDDANKELKELYFKEEKFIPEVWDIISESILPRYKKFIYHMQNKRIAKTSNLIENFFSKTMPKH